jgi:hypothetical protein
MQDGHTYVIVGGSLTGASAVVDQERDKRLYLLIGDENTFPMRPPLQKLCSARRRSRVPPHDQKF